MAFWPVWPLILITVCDACNSQDIIQSAVSRGLTGAAVQGTGSQGMDINRCLCEFRNLGPCSALGTLQAGPRISEFTPRTQCISEHSMFTVNYYYMSICMLF